jgi:hypothetical protein
MIGFTQELITTRNGSLFGIEITDEATSFTNRRQFGEFGPLLKGNKGIADSTKWLKMSDDGRLAVNKFKGGLGGTGMDGAIMDVGSHSHGIAIVSRWEKRRSKHGTRGIANGSMEAFRFSRKGMVIGNASLFDDAPRGGKGEKILEELTTLVDPNIQESGVGNSFEPSKERLENGKGSSRGGGEQGLEFNEGGKLVDKLDIIGSPINGF